MRSRHCRRLRQSKRQILWLNPAAVLTEFHVAAQKHFEAIHMRMRMFRNDVVRRGGKELHLKRTPPIPEDRRDVFDTVYHRGINERHEPDGPGVFHKLGEKLGQHVHSKPSCHEPSARSAADFQRSRLDYCSGIPAGADLRHCVRAMAARTQLTRDRLVHSQIRRSGVVLVAAPVRWPALGRGSRMLTTIRHYRRGWLLPDISAGLVLAAFLVPTGMGYAPASGLPVEYGLYASIASLVAYFCVGPSQILVVGPDSALVPLVASSLAAVPAAAAPGRAALIAVLAGLFCISGGLMRLGFLTDLISKPVRIGYLNGIAVTVMAGPLRPPAWQA